MLTVLLVEDDPTIRLATEYALTREGYAVSSATSGKEGLEKYRAIKPDLIVLDVMLPELSGLEVARNIRREDALTPIIMLTALDSLSDKVAGLDCGADDYLTKPFSAAELMARIRANLRQTGEVRRELSDRVIEVGDLTIDKEAARITAQGTELPLRSKEYSLLVFLAENPGKLCTRERLSEQIWGEEFLATSRTIDVHIRRVRSLLEEHSEFEYIHTVHGMGYRFEPVRRDTGEKR